MHWPILLTLFVACLTGSVVQAVTGFGFAVISLPVIALVLPFRIASVTVGLLGCAISWLLLYRLRRHVDYRALWIPLAASLAGRVPGVHALVHVRPAILQAVLGVLLLLLALWLARWRLRVAIRATPANGAIAGLTGGVLGGMCGMPGPPLAAYFSSALPDRHRCNATLQAFFAIGATYNVVLYVMYGAIDSPVAVSTAFGAIATVLGAALGFALFRRLKAAAIDRAMWVFVMLIGLTLLAQAGAATLAR